MLPFRVESHALLLPRKMKFDQKKITDTIIEKDELIEVITAFWGLLLIFCVRRRVNKGLWIDASYTYYGRGVLRFLSQTRLEKIYRRLKLVYNLNLAAEARQEHWYG